MAILGKLQVRGLDESHGGAELDLAHRALLPVSLVGGAIKDGTEASDHVTLIVESGVGGDLGGGAIVVAQHGECTLHTSSPFGLVRPQTSS